MRKIIAAAAPLISTDARKANFRVILARARAPMTVEHLTKLAVSYEAAYRRNRASRRPSERALLFGALLTARAVYSLAREVARG